MRRLIRKIKEMTLIEWMILAAIFFILLAIITGELGNDYSGHPATHRDLGVVQDVHHNVSQVVEVCNDGQMYIVRHGRLVSLDERC